MVDDLFAKWLAEETPSPAPNVRVFRERDGTRKSALPTLARVMVDHFVGTALVLRAGGYSKAAAIIRDSLPESKRTRSGDLGEVLASEFVESETPYTVPIRKLRWKDDREMPMRGNDVIAVDPASKPPQVLKVESKSRARLDGTVVAEAAESLDGNSGRPNPATIAFIIKRLYEQDRDGEAKIFERFLSHASVKPKQLSHCVFVLCGADPSAALTRLPSPKRTGIARFAAAVVIDDHAAFIAAAYKSAHGARP